MNNEIYFNIISQIEVIRKTDELISKLKAIQKDKYEFDTIKPYELRKYHLVEELLVEMIKGKLSFTQFKSLYEKIFAYLEKGENINLLPKDLQKKVNRAEQFLEPSTL